MPVAGITPQAALGALTGPQTRTLLELAYDHPNAIRNAQNKYRDPAALAARAIERIQQDSGRVATLAQRDPELARLVGGASGTRRCRGRVRCSRVAAPRSTN
jgi:hypothetical protein